MTSRMDFIHIMKILRSFYDSKFQGIHSCRPYTHVHAVRCFQWEQNGSGVVTFPVLFRLDLDIRCQAARHHDESNCKAIRALGLHIVSSLFDGVIPTEIRHEYRRYCPR